ncbi:hypothetical protein ACFX19_041458 [Malus domestica]
MPSNKYNQRTKQEREREIEYTRDTSNAVNKGKDSPTKGPCNALNTQREREYTRDTSNAVNKGKDSPTKGPCNALNAHRGALVACSGNPHECEDSYVQEEKGGYELSNPNLPEKPGLELAGLEQ